MILRFKRKEGMSLVELLMALVLLNMLIMTGVSMEFGIRRVLSSADAESRVMGEISPIVTQLTKDVNRAIGNAQASPACRAYQLNILAGCNPSIVLRRDSNGNGVAEATDLTVGYGWNAASFEIRYYPNAAVAAYDVLSNKITDFSIAAGTGVIRFGIRGRLLPAQAVNLSNPEITVNSSAFLLASPSA